MQAADQLNKIMGTFYEGQNAAALREMDLCELDRNLSDLEEEMEIILDEWADLLKRMHKL